MHWISQDFRYALRGLRNQPSFAFLAILALALGIGASTTTFSAIYGILLNPFPYTNADRIVNFSPHDPVTLVGVMLMVTGVGLAACYFPAKRATRVDPMVALRYE